MKNYGPILAAVVIGLTAWGLFHTVGAYQGAELGDRNIFRSLVVASTFALFMGFWVILTMIGTLTVGYLASFLPAPRKSDEELEGLVLGLGRIGQIEPPEATLLIDTSFDDEPDERGE